MMSKKIGRTPGETQISTLEVTPVLPCCSSNSSVWNTNKCFGSMNSWYPGVVNGS
jgi:hypothetical protein